MPLNVHMVRARWSGLDVGHSVKFWRASHILKCVFVESRLDHQRARRSGWAEVQRAVLVESLVISVRWHWREMCVLYLLPIFFISRTMQKQITQCSLYHASANSTRHSSHVGSASSLNRTHYQANFSIAARLPATSENTYSNHLKLSSE